MKGGWRRVEVALNIPTAAHKPMAHTLCIEKMQPRSMRAKEYSEMIIGIVARDIEAAAALREIEESDDGK